MKKILYLAFLVLGLTVKTYADEKKEAEVSYFAENTFLSRYQGASNVKWTVTSRFQKASFTLEGKQMSAFFDPTGEYIATTQYVDVDKLPAISKTRLQKLYKDCKIEEVVRYDLDGDASNIFMLTGERSYNTIYFASVKHNDQKMVLKITPDGEVSFLQDLK